MKLVDSACRLLASSGRSGRRVAQMVLAAAAAVVLLGACTNNEPATDPSAASTSGAASAPPAATATATAAATAAAPAPGPKKADSSFPPVKKYTGSVALPEGWPVKSFPLPPGVSGTPGPKVNVNALNVRIDTKDTTAATAFYLTKLPANGYKVSKKSDGSIYFYGNGLLGQISARAAANVVTLDIRLPDNA